MGVVGRLDQYASMLAYEFDETTANNPSITGLGTYYASEFSENVGIATTMTANIFPPYDLVYDEFGGTLFGPGQGRYMRQNTDKSVIVYNEIDEIGLMPSCVISPSTTSVNEGSSVIFSVTATNVENGTTLYYDITGSVGIASTDFTNSSLSGSLSVSGTFDLGYGSTTLTLANDFITEGTETFNMNLRTGSISGPIVTTSPTITISDTSNASSIITSGLVMNLDAGNASSYPGSGTTWYDLSGSGNDGTLTLGPTYSSANGGSIVFDGVNDYVNISGSTTVSQATFSVWLRRDGAQSSYAGILFSRSSSVSGLNFYSTSNTLGYHWNGEAGSYNFNSGLTPPNGAWCMVALSVTSATATFYLCQSSGITTATNTLAHASTTLDALNLGQDANGSRNTKGNIAQASIYNRALSAAEVSQNYNALKGRFGL